MTESRKVSFAVTCQTQNGANRLMEEVFAAESKTRIPFAKMDGSYYYGLELGQYLAHLLVIEENSLR